MSKKNTIYAIECDQYGREEREKWIASLGYRYRSFSTPDQYLDAPTRTEPGCLLVVGTTGDVDCHALFSALSTRRVGIPAVVLDANISVEQAVRCMQRGAFTVIADQDGSVALRVAIESALSEDARRLEQELLYRELSDKARALTDRERLVMDSMVAGKLNKVIARELDVSVRTVEQTRARVFKKFRADTPAQLASMATELRMLDQQVHAAHDAPAKPQHYSPAGQKSPERSLRLSKLLCV